MKAAPKRRRAAGVFSRRSKSKARARPRRSRSRSRKRSSSKRRINRRRLTVSRKTRKSRSRSRTRSASRSKRRRSSSRTRRRRSRSRSGSTQRKGLAGRSSRRKRAAPSTSFNLAGLKVPISMTDVKFNSYLKKLLKEKRPELGLNSESVQMLDRLMKSVLHSLATQAATKMGRRKVLVPKVIIRGMKRILPKGFSAKADERGQQALDRFKRNKKKKRTT